jgi:hypothetical protein
LCCILFPWHCALKTCPCCSLCQCSHSDCDPVLHGWMDHGFVDCRWTFVLFPPFGC